MLRVRCAACGNVSAVADENAGREVACASCGAMLPAPIPRARNGGMDVACPRCGFASAPGTRECRRCGTNLTSGRRPNLLNRLRYLTPSGWIKLSITAVMLLFAAVAARHFYTTTQHPGDVRSADGAGAGARGVAAIDALFSAPDRAALADAARSLQVLDASLAPQVADRLSQSLASSTRDSLVLAAQLEAVDFLARSGADDTTRERLASVLKRCEKVAHLRAAAVRARALTGDMQAAAAANEVWALAAQELITLHAVEKQADPTQRLGVELAIRQAELQLSRAGEALRALAATDPKTLDGALCGYWESWGWAGQGRGEDYAGELLDALSGGAAPDEALRPLERAAESLDAVAAAAALAVVAECPGDHDDVERRLCARLGVLLATCGAREQQLIIWALARGTGRYFGVFCEKNHPFEVDADEVRAACDWLRETGLADVDAKVVKRSYPVGPPVHGGR